MSSHGFGQYQPSTEQSMRAMMSADNCGGNQYIYQQLMQQAPIDQQDKMKINFQFGVQIVKPELDIDAYKKLYLQTFGNESEGYKWLQSYNPDYEEALKQLNDEFPGVREFGGAR